MGRLLVLFIVWVELVLGGCVGAQARRVDPSSPDDHVPVGYLGVDFAGEKQEFQTTFEIGVSNGYLPVDVVEGKGGVILVLTPNFGEPVTAVLRGDVDGNSRTFAEVAIQNGRAAFYPEMWEGLVSTRPTSVALLFLNRGAERREDAVRAWRTFTFRTPEGDLHQPF